MALINVLRPLALLAACVVGMGGLPESPRAQTTGTTQSEASAIWEKISGSWTTTKGAVKEQWGKLTDDDLMEIEGRRQQLVGKIQSRYGIPREEAEAQVGRWERNYRRM